MAKKQLKYRPLKVVQDVMQVTDKLEQWRKKNPLAIKKAQIDKAIEYSVDFTLQKNRLKKGQHVPPNIRSRLEYEGYTRAITAMVAMEWKNNKQVYRFSREFYDMLLEVGDFKIGWSLFKYLPYSSFYLEVEGHEKIEGVMIRYMQCDGEEGSLFYTICCKSKDFPEIISGINDPTENEYFEEYFRTGVLKSGVREITTHVLLMKEVFAFVFQACMYLCANNSEIEENPEQKRIYKPSNTISNKCSEIRKWDVGIRITRALKAQSGTTSTNNPIVISGTRRRPRQHLRKAHWHTYWIGPKGNQKKTLKFIAPILVNDNNDDMPVVIHQ